MSDPSRRGPHHGVSFAPPLHSKPEGPTDPSSVKLPTPYIVAVVGASRGIGASIAVAYAKAGASGFLLTARVDSSLHDTAREILHIRPGAKIVCQGADVTSVEEMREAAGAVETAFGRLDVCVVSAGISEPMLKDPDTGDEHWPRGLVEGTPETFVQVMDTNVKGPILAAKFFIPILEAAGRPTGFIVISSAAAHFSKSEAMPASYALSKMAATRLVEQVHEGHGKNGKGVNAFAVHPGGVMTDMGDSAPMKLYAKFLTDDPGLCGGMCVWLTSQDRSWLSGRWISSKWDIGTLESMRQEIVDGDKLKFRMAV